MKFTFEQKEQIKQQILSCLISQREISKILIFGSFNSLEEPNDIDVAIFQDSEDSYLKLAMKYRKLTKEISKKYL